MLYPEHIVPLLIVITGKAETVIVLTTLVVIQPLVAVPITPIEVLVVGARVALPFEYVYVLAPVGTIVNVAPLQMLPLFTVMVGLVAMVMLATAVFEATQPKELVPVTLILVFDVATKVLLPFE
jgi:hypothetical protein